MCAYGENRKVQFSCNSSLILMPVFGKLQLKEFSDFFNGIFWAGIMKGLGPKLCKGFSQ